MCRPFDPFRFCPVNGASVRFSLFVKSQCSLVNPASICLPFTLLWVRDHETQVTWEWFASKCLDDAVY